MKCLLCEKDSATLIKDSNNPFTIISKCEDCGTLYMEPVYKRKLEMYLDIDFLLLLMLEKRYLYNIVRCEMAQLLNITIDQYKDIEEGFKILNKNQREAVCEKFSITEFTKEDFFDANFKLIK